MNKVQRIIQLHNNVRENSGMGDAAYGCGATLDARSYYAAAESATKEFNTLLDTLTPEENAELNALKPW